MKRILLALLISLMATIFLGCDCFNQIADWSRDISLGSMIHKHEIYYADFGDFSGDESIDQKIFKIVSIINTNIEYTITAGEDYILPNPQEIWERGYADCDGFAILLMNILYVELGIKSQLVITNITPQRAVVSGGTITHAAIFLDDKVYEPQTGRETDYIVNYIYSFEFVFSADF